MLTVKQKDKCWLFLPAGISDEDKNVIVSKHNEYRSGVNPRAVAMAKMVSKSHKTQPPTVKIERDL